MSFFKMTLRPTDRRFSNYIRARDNWTCQNCGKKFKAPATRALHNSHFFDRGIEATRFDPQNCDAICITCHELFAGGPNNKLYEAFKIKQLGQRAFDLLCIRANTHKGRDDKMDVIYINILTKELNGA